MVAAADAVAREYHILPTRLLGLNLSEGSHILISARILAHRNEQAKLMSLNDPQAKNARGVPTEDLIRAKRMKWKQQRKEAMLKHGLKE